MANPLIEDLNESLLNAKFPRLCEAIASAETPEDHLQSILTLLWKVAGIPETTPDLRQVMRKTWEETLQARPWDQSRVPFPLHFVGPVSDIHGPVLEAWFTKMFRLILMTHVPEVLSVGRKVSNALLRALSEIDALPDRQVSLPAWRQGCYRVCCWPDEKLFSTKEYVKISVIEFVGSTMTESEWRNFVQSAKEETRVP